MKIDQMWNVIKNAVLRSDATVRVYQQQVLRLTGLHSCENELPSRVLRFANEKISVTLQQRLGEGSRYQPVKPFFICKAQLVRI